MQAKGKGNKLQSRSFLCIPHHGWLQVSIYMHAEDFLHVRVTVPHCKEEI